MKKKEALPKVLQLPYFISRMSTLLNEGYTFAECIDMLLPYHVKDHVKWSKTIQQDFRNGASITVIFQRLGLKKQYLMSIELAEMNGTLASTLETVAKQLHFATTFKGQLQKVIVYPACLFGGLVCLFIAFRLKFLPSIQQMMHTRTGDDESSSVQWSKFFLHTPDYFMLVLLVLTLLSVCFMFYMSKRSIAMQISILLKIPFICYYFRLKWTRQFSRIVGELLLTGFSLQDALDVLMQQQHQKQVRYIATVIHQRVVYGDSLAQAVVIYDYFYMNFEQFIAHGEHSGLLGRELILYAELLEQKLYNGLKLSAKIIQPMMFLVIAICIIAAYLSILLPMYSMLDVI